MTKHKSDDFVTRARRFCPEYPKVRPSVTSCVERQYIPAPPANEEYLQAAFSRWTNEINTQRVSTGFEPIVHQIVSEIVEPPIAA